MSRSTTPPGSETKTQEEQQEIIRFLDHIRAQVTAFSESRDPSIVYKTLREQLISDVYKEDAGYRVATYDDRVRRIVDVINDKIIRATEAVRGRESSFFDKEPDIARYAVNPIISAVNAFSETEVLNQKTLTEQKDYLKQIKKEKSDLSDEFKNIVDPSVRNETRKQEISRKCTDIDGQIEATTSYIRKLSTISGWCDLLTEQLARINSKKYPFLYSTIHTALRIIHNANMKTEDSMFHEHNDPSAYAYVMNRLAITQSLFEQATNAREVMSDAVGELTDRVTKQATEATESQSKRLISRAEEEAETQRKLAAERAKEAEQARWELQSLKDGALSDISRATTKKACYVPNLIADREYMRSVGGWCEERMNLLLALKSYCQNKTKTELN